MNREEFFKKHNYECEVCHKPLRIDTGEIAHRLNEGPVNRRYFGNPIIDHPFNKGITCPGRCNSALLVDNKPLKKRALLIKIIRDIYRKEKEYFIDYKIRIAFKISEEEIF